MLLAVDTLLTAYNKYYVLKNVKFFQVAFKKNAVFSSQLPLSHFCNSLYVSSSL